MANEKTETKTEKKTEKKVEVEMMLIPVIRGANGVDIEKTLEAAVKPVEEYSEKDAEETTAVVAAVDKILTSDKPAHKEMKHVTASTLAKMALGLMGEIPTDARCDETEVRVKAFLNAQTEKFIHIQRGRLSGYWFRSRLSAEDLKKLLKEKNA